MAVEMSLGLATFNVDNDNAVASFDKAVRGVSHNLAGRACQA